MKTLQQSLRNLDPQKFYTTEEIAGMKIILNSKMEPSNFTLYRLIHKGTLKAVKLGSGTKFPRYAVKGEELIKFINSRFTK